MSQSETAQVKLPEQRPAGPGEEVVPVADTPEGVEDAMRITYDPNAAENAAYEAGREARSSL